MTYKNRHIASFVDHSYRDPVNVDLIYKSETHDSLSSRVQHAQTKLA